MEKNNYLLPNWNAPKNVQAFTTTINTAFCKASVNDFALNTRESLEAFTAGTSALIQDLSLPSRPIWLNQQHGNNIIHINPQSIDQFPLADGSFTTSTNRISAVLTADCLPLLICDKYGMCVAAIHAGWKGIKAGIIEKTIESLPVPPKDLLIWLGPAIGPNKFEVSEDFFSAFVKEDPEAKSAFAKIIATPNKWLANIYMLARLRLKKYGITNIFGGNHCTYTESKNFFSFRRDFGKTGRMASLIWLR